MLDLNQNVATKIAVGPAVDPVSALSVSTMSIANSDAAVVIKHGTSVEQSIKAYTFSHSSVASGIGFITLSAATLDTVGQLTVIVEDLSLHLPVIHHYRVLSSGMYNALYGGTIWASQSSAIATEVWGTTSRILTASTNFTIPTASAIASQVWSYPTGSTTQSNHIASQVWSYPTSRTLTAATNFNNLSQDQVSVIVTSALNTYDPPTRTEATADKASLIAEFVLTNGAGFNTTTDSIEVIASIVASMNSNTVNLSSITSAIWSATTANYTTAGTTGADLLSTLNIVSALSAGGATQDQVSVIVTSIFNTYDPPTRTEATADKASLIAEFVLTNGATFNTATDSLEAIRDRGDAAWLTGGGGTASAIASAVWDDHVKRTLAASAYSAVASQVWSYPTSQTLQVQQIASAVWEELLTGVTHNVATSAGRRLRELAGTTLTADTAQAGSADTITLAAGESATDGLYVGTGIILVVGTGSGQSRYIVGYNGTTKVATVARPWTTNPDSSSEYVVVADNQIDYLQMGLATAGAAGSITLDANASATDDVYIGQGIRIFGGTGKFQIRTITAYNGTTKVATVDRNWETTPDATSFYAVLGHNSNLLPDAVGSMVASQVWSYPASGVAFSTIGSYAGTPTIDVSAISDEVWAYVGSTTAHQTIVSGVWGHGTRILTASTNFNIPTALNIASQIASYTASGVWFSTLASQVWGTTTRILTAATNFQDLSQDQVSVIVTSIFNTYDPPTRTEATTDKTSLIAEFALLNDVSQDQVSVIVTSVFNTYDPPTRTEATTDKTSLIAEFALLNDVTALEVASQVWSFTGLQDGSIAGNILTSTMNLASSLSAGGATQDQVSVIVTSIFNTYDPPTRTEATTDKASLIAEFALLNDVTALEVASQVWSYTGSGVAFSTIASAVGTGFNAASVWNEASRSLTDKSDFHASVVSTVSDKTGYTVATGGFPVGGYAAGAITAAAIATDAIGAAEISSSANEAIADAILNRDLAGGNNGASRGVRNALRVLRNRVDASTGIVYAEDDAAVAWSFITSTVAGNPIVAIDPA